MEIHCGDQSVGVLSMLESAVPEIRKTKADKNAIKFIRLIAAFL